MGYNICTQAGNGKNAPPAMEQSVFGKEGDKKGHDEERAKCTIEGKLKSSRKTRLYGRHHFGKRGYLEHCPLERTVFEDPWMSRIGGYSESTSNVEDAEDEAGQDRCVEHFGRGLRGLVGF